MRRQSFLTVLLFRSTEKKICPISRPSSGNLWTIFNHKFLKLVQLVLRICSIKSPKSHPNMNVIFGQVIISAALISGQVVADGFEIIPFTGYRFGGSLEEQDTGNTRDFDEGSSWGVILGRTAGQTTRYEILYSYQDSGLTDKTDPDNAFDLEIHYLHLGGTVDISQERIIPFVSGGLGMTHMSPDRFGLENETLFSLSLGGGLKWYPTNSLGLRFEVRGYGTLTESSGSLFCDGGCDLQVNGTLLPQFETNLGLIFRF